MKFGFRITDLIKAAPGMERGPKAFHKYISRRLVWSKGKRSYVYYYANQNQLEQGKAVTHEGDAQHKLVSELPHDAPMLRNARKSIGDVTADYLQSLFSSKKAPKITIEPGVINKFHKPVADAHKSKASDTEPILGSPTSPYRAIELAVEMLPPHLRSAFGETLNEIIIGENMGLGRNVAGKYYPQEHVIRIDALKTLAPYSKHPHPKGGLFASECVLHEMAHALETSLGAFGHDVSLPGWKGKTFKDFEQWYQRKGQKEQAITEHAKKNVHERWAESFTAALMFPVDLALTSEATYDWFRDFFGHEYMRPIHTDRDGIRELQEQLKAAKGDREKILAIQHKIDMLQGVLDMPHDDPRLQWWTGKKSKVQKLLAEAPAGTYGAVDDNPRDRFYEMSHNGRTVFFRYGPSGSKTKDFTDWEPGKHGAADKSTSGVMGYKRLVAAVSEIKEIYDADGKPLTNDNAWWYLHQDDPEFRDGGAEAEGLITFQTDAQGNVLASKDQQKIIDRNKFNKLMSYDSHTVAVQRTKGVSAEDREKEPRIPVQISRDEFRLRSGTFTFDQWQIAGHDALEKMKRSTYGSKEWEAAFEEVRKEQPWVSFHQEGSGAREYRRGTGPEADLIQDEKTGGWIPQFHTIRFVNENPDGSKTYIAARRSKEGKYYLADPVWRKLITPFGDDITGSQDLILKFKQAAEARFGGPPDFLPSPRRTWIDVRTDPKKAGDTEHYYHLEVEFDGRGSPRILGDLWKQKTGKLEPRLEDLLSAGGKIVSDPIKVGKQTRRNKRLPPFIGERIVLTARTDELGTKDPKDVIVKLVRVVPGKKAGEVPSPPGWDRMPEGVSTYLPVPEDDEEGQKLTPREKELKKKGLLPDWYKATANQRDWVEKVYEPAHAEWERTKEEVTAKKLDPVYVMVGEANGGAGGTTFRRYGLKDVADSVRVAVVERVPDPLPHDLLCYLHQELDAVTGDPVGPPELRLLPPKDGTFSEQALEGLPGVTVHRAPVPEGETGDGAIEWISAGIEGFARLRTVLGGLSMTAEAERHVHAAVDDLKILSDEIAAGEHSFSLEEIDPPLLKAMGVDIVDKAPNGTRYELPRHARKGIQKMIDGGMRGFAAHFMGTGKTHLGLVAAKMAVAIHRNPKLASDHGLNPADFPNKVLVVAPLQTIGQWKQAVDEFDGGAQVIGDSKDAMSVSTYLKSGDTSDVVIIGPKYFQLHAKELHEMFDMIIVDEAHQGIKNEKAERNMELKAFNEKLKGLILMTGTPETMGPWDWVQYVQLITQGKVWGNMTEAQFIKEFCDESAIPGELGSDRKGPRVVIKPSKRREFAAIVASVCDVALTKDVVGKTLPAIHRSEHEHAHMVGIQARLFTQKMTGVPEKDLAALADNAAMARGELEGISEEAQKSIAAAKSIANCLAVKNSSEAKFIQYSKITPQKDGPDTVSQDNFETFDPDQLMKRDAGELGITNKAERNRRKGKWPRIDEIGAEQAGIYDMHLSHVLGEPYAALEGTPITPEQLAKMKADGWPKKIDNPEWGPLGIRFRGTIEPSKDPKVRDRIARAQELQRAFSVILAKEDENGKPLFDPDTALVFAAQEVGVSVDEARSMKAMRPDEGEFKDTVTSHGVTVTTADWWVSDKTASMHWLYHPDDCDPKTGKPLAGGGFEKVKSGDTVIAELPKKYAPSPKELEGKDWSPPVFIYDETQGKNARGEVALIAQSSGEPPGKLQEGEVVWVKPDKIQAIAKSLNHPGFRIDRKTGRKVRLRDERQKADVAMTHGNAKSEQLRAYLGRFFLSTGDGNFAEGEDGSRQLILFGGDILGAVRMAEATARTEGFRDVNEMIEGSPWYDPDDADPAPNGKYYVTYLGKAGTVGDRDLNITIMTKVKDKLNRDSQTSLFVRNTMEGRKWKAFSGDTASETVLRSHWSQDQRDKVYAAFKIMPPEAIYLDGPKGKQRKMYFYGTKESAKILEQMKDLPDPARVADKATADKTLATLKDLKARYEAIVVESMKKKGPDGKMITRGDPPLTQKQIAIFDNCALSIFSDAAQVGINAGNAVEQVQLDSLPSPQAEAQRVTRSARVMPNPVHQRIMDPQIIAVKGIKGKKFAFVHNIETNAINERNKGAQVQISWEDENKEEHRQWVDRLAITQDRSPVEKLRQMEPKLFEPGARGAPSGSVKGFRITGGDAAVDTTVHEALSSLAAFAQERAATVGNKVASAQWEKIAAQARVGSSLGILQAVDALHNLAGTKMPGSRDNVISFPDQVGGKGNPQYTDPMAGTYKTGVDAGIPPEEAIREAFDEVLNDRERELFAEAGYVMADDKTSSYDPVAVYMSIRAQEILDHIAQERPKVESRLRAASAGAIVTEGDVFNNIIESLSPSDRSILKQKKLLVDVTRLSVSVDMPQFQAVKEVSIDEEGKKITTTRQEFTGFEREQPVRIETNVLAMQRSRQRPFEERMADIQAGLAPDVPLDFQTTDSKMVAELSRIPDDTAAKPKGLGISAQQLAARSAAK